MLFYFLNDSFSSPESAVIIFLITIFAFIFSLSLHEFAHAFSAYKMGDVTAKQAGRLTLNPFKHLSPIGFVAGGGEYNDLNSKRNSADFPMAGGTGGGFTVTPIGFFVVNNNKFKIIHADKSSAYLDLIKNATEVLKSFVEKMK